VVNPTSQRQSRPRNQPSDHPMTPPSVPGPALARVRASDDTNTRAGPAVEQFDPSQNVYPGITRRGVTERREWDVRDRGRPTLRWCLAGGAWCSACDATISRTVLVGSGSRGAWVFVTRLRWNRQEGFEQPSMAGLPANRSSIQCAASPNEAMYAPPWSLPGYVFTSSGVPSAHARLRHDSVTDGGTS
jgi:hypothetical protein